MQNEFFSSVATTIMTISDPASSSLLMDKDNTSKSEPTFVQCKRKTESNKSYIGDIGSLSSSKLILGSIEATSTVSIFEKAIKAIKNYESLNEDWDGYGGVSPSSDIIKTAIKLLIKLDDECLPIPKTMVSGSGSVGFYWKSGGKYIEIEIDTLNKYDIYMSENDKYEGQENISIDNSLEYSLKSTLKTLFA